MKRKPYLFYCSLFFLALFAFAFPVRVHANGMEKYNLPEDDYKETKEIEVETKTDKQDLDKGFLEEGALLAEPTPYVESSLPNLAKMYWRFNLLDIDSDEDIDNFLFCTECETYIELRNHDFAWEGIRERIRQYIRKNKETFSNRIYFTAMVELGRYDFERKGFPLSKETKFEAVKKILMSDNLGKECFTRYHINGYPHNVALSLKRPVYIDFIKVDEKIANMYTEYLHNQSKISVNHDGRIAYLKVNATALYHMEDVIDQNYGDYGVFFGELDSYELYADPGLFLKMGGKNLLLDK